MWHCDSIGCILGTSDLGLLPLSAIRPSSLAYPADRHAWPLSTHLIPHTYSPDLFTQTLGPAYLAVHRRAL